MKKIIYILVLSLFVFNCSKSDDDNSSESCNTFLECNDGSTWIMDSDGVINLWRINNNKNNLIELWDYFSVEECYNYSRIGESDGLTITENTKDKLVIKNDYGSGDIETLTFSIVNGELKIVYGITDSSETYEDTLVLQETTIDVDKLTICT